MYLLTYNFKHVILGLLEIFILHNYIKLHGLKFQLSKFKIDYLNLFLKKCIIKV